jgi:DNA-binding transcriptional regulator of glucitol operon
METTMLIRATMIVVAVLALSACSAGVRDQIRIVPVAAATP